jgi:crotonobetainyl-CoA:carnitine CoA-transferase CaiB-like acyl-CoA transferase
VAGGALEQQFYAQLLDGLGVHRNDVPDRSCRDNWPALRERFAAAFASRTRDEWAAIFDGTDACVTPVLRFDEVGSHPHTVARASVVERDGVEQAAPAPRFSRTVLDPLPTDPWMSDPWTSDPGADEPRTTDPRATGGSDSHDLDSVLTRWRSQDAHGGAGAS